MKKLEQQLSNVPNCYVTVGQRRDNHRESLSDEEIVTGCINNKTFEISKKNIHMCSLEKRITIKLFLKTILDATASIRKRPVLSNFHKILDTSFYEVRDPILRDKVIISSDNSLLVDNILRYDEIVYKISNLWDGAKSQQSIFICQNYIAYIRDYFFLTQNCREKIVDAVNLLCDIADVINSTNSRNNHE